jgi:hypothetical protein
MTRSKQPNSFRRPSGDARQAPLRAKGQMTYVLLVYSRMIDTCHPGGRRSLPKGLSLNPTKPIYKKGSNTQHYTSFHTLGQIWCHNSEVWFLFKCYRRFLIYINLIGSLPFYIGNQTTKPFSSHL